MAKVLERPDLYDEDFYVWSKRQAELLRARRFDELDLENLIEEVDDLGGALKRSLFNNTAVILEHLLKLQHSPAQEPVNGWRRSVREHRRRVRYEITPHLRQLLLDELEDIFEAAAKDAGAAMRDYGEDEAAGRLPKDCPYTVEQILGDWLPER